MFDIKKIKTRVIYVDPASIVSQYTFVSVKKTPFKSRVAVRGVIERFVYGKRWEDTEYYKRRIKGSYGETPGRKATDKYLAHKDEMFKRMKANGFGDGETMIGVRIVDGEVCFCHDGQHRLAFSQILKFKKIPVKVYEL